MTPIRRYSAQIDVFRKNMLPHMNSTFLNKAEQKLRPFSWRDNSPIYTKGVSSDSILIFKDKSANVSCAFSFNYIDLEDNQQNITATIKLGEKIIASKPLSLLKFKDCINEMNSWFKTSPSFTASSAKNSLLILDKFEEIFVKKKFNIIEDVKNQEKRLEEVKKEKYKNLKLDVMDVKLIELNEKLRIDKKLITKTIEDLPEFKEQERLTKELNKISAIVNKKTTELNNKLDIVNKTKEIEDLSFRLSKAKTKFDEEMKKEIKSYGILVSTEINKKIKPK